MATTTTLFKIVASELQKMGLNEFEGSKPATDVFPYGDFVFYDKDFQFTEKILNFDYDVQTVIGWLFHGYSLDYVFHDEHFKKMFLLRFANREINFQTVESFKFALISSFLSQKEYINRVYDDLEKYIQQQTTNESKSLGSNNTKSNGNNITDNRQAYIENPQDEVNLDLNKTTTTYATDNTISKNKVENTNSSDTIMKNDSRVIGTSLSLDELIKSSSIMENILKEFDRKCFLQIF